MQCVPWFKPDSPLLEEEVAKSTSILVPSVAEVFPDVVSGATPLNGHTCQFQDTICAYRSGCISSETVQDGPFLLQCVLGPAAFFLLACCLRWNSKASTKKPRWPVGRKLMPHAIRGSIAIQIPLIQGGFRTAQSNREHQWIYSGVNERGLHLHWTFVAQQEMLFYLNAFHGVSVNQPTYLMTLIICELNSFENPAFNRMGGP